jgi:hypothetical protein
MIIIAYYMIGLNPAFSAYLLCGLIASLVGMTGTVRQYSSLLENIKL